MMVEGNRGHHLNAVPYLGKILISGIQGEKVSKIQVSGHFKNFRPFEVSNFLHDGRRQKGASFECGAIFKTNLNQGIKGD